MEINFDKTEYIAITKEEVKNLEVDENLKIKGKDKFKNLGFVISKMGTTQEEIKSRLGQRRTCIKQLHPILWNTHITKNTKRRIHDTIVRRIMTYGAENLVVNKINANKKELQKSNSDDVAVW